MIDAIGALFLANLLSLKSSKINENTNQTLNCPYGTCTYKYVPLDRLKIHLRDVHKVTHKSKFDQLVATIDKIQCTNTKCPKMFSCEKGLKAHLMGRCEYSEENYICKNHACNIRFKNETLLNEHEESGSYK